MENLEEVKRSLEKTIDDKITEVHSLVQRINRETDFCGFFDNSGHIGAISVSIAISKKNYNTKFRNYSLVDYVVDYDDDTEENDGAIIIGEINKVIMDLKMILNGAVEEYVKIPLKKAAEFRELYYLDYDNNFNGFTVDAVGEYYVYDKDGNKYTDVYEKIVSGVKDG